MAEESDRLTQRQREIFNYIREKIENRDMAQLLGKLGTTSE